MSYWFNILGTCKSWIRVTHGIIQCMSIHVWHQQMDPLSEFQGSRVGHVKYFWHQESRYRDMWNHDVIWAVILRSNLDHWFYSLSKFQGLRVGHVKDYWHQESRYHDMWNHDAIWAIRSIFDLDRWWRGIEDRELDMTKIIDIRNPDFSICEFMI